MSFSSTTKYDYIEVVNRFVPEFYRELDYTKYGSEEDISLTFLGKLLKAATLNDLIFDVDEYTKEEIAEFFLPEGRTTVSPKSFESNILIIYGKNWDSFTTKDDFKSWLSGTFFPDIPVNAPSAFNAQISGLAFGEYSSLSATHLYLVEQLGMFYFMNASSLSGASTNASAVAIDYLADQIYIGEEASDKDAINALYRFFWDNRESSTFYKSFFPPSHSSGISDLSSNEYLSGTQMFESIRLQLEAWTDPRLKNHSFYRASLNALLTDSTAEFPTQLRDAGPFQRFLKAISLGIADINLIIEEIGDLLSIDDCPEKFLELLANNIGWKFLTGDFKKWRSQLRNAVMLYKTKGSTIGLDAAIKLIFPDGVFTSSDIVESWESYIPKLLYYLIKTESFIAKEELEFKPKDEVFEGGWPSRVRCNQAAVTYQDAKDRNYRFLVDAILEHFHNTFEGIIIGGKDFRTLPMWSCLPTKIVGDEETQGKGFYHRNYPNDPAAENGFFVAVPPWEKYGFYKECELDTERVEFFCNVLSGSRSDFGFEVPENIVSEFKSFVTSAIESVYVLEGKPQYAQNNRFRFFCENHTLPPNYSSLVIPGNTDSLKDFDIWNTKASFLFASFAASSLDYTLNAYDTYRNRAALQTFYDILKQTLPLHAVIRIILYQDLEDNYTASQTLNVISDQCLDDFNTGYLNSKRTDFWAGASGTGSLGITYVNGDGRVLPSYLSADGDWWQASATDLDRNASRRRDYRYSLECYPYVRSGKGMPIALNHYKIATSSANTSENPYINTWEYIIKGFEYDKQDFLPMSSTVWAPSGFYDVIAGCAVTGTISDFDLSTVYPVRAVPETDYASSSVLIYRDTLKGVMEVMTARKIRDDKFASLSDDDYKSFEFGNTVHESYSIYKNEFSGLLKNTLSPNTPYYGGYNFISYAFGPTVWNSDFRHLGEITNASIPTYFPGLSVSKYGYEAQWSSIVGGTTAGSQSYLNQHGGKVTLKPRTYFASAPDVVSDENVGVSRSREFLSTREIVSGIELRQTTPQSKSFVVVNNQSVTKTENTTPRYSITMFNPDGNPLSVVVPFRPSDSSETHYNKLRPQSQFSIDIHAKTNGFKSQEIKIELVTSGLLDDAGNAAEWTFDWFERKWRLTNNIKEDFRFTTLTVPQDEECPKPYTVTFHTEDIFTEKALPCTTPFKTGDVHTSSTTYLLKISNPTISPTRRDVLVDGLTIYEISITDRLLNQSMNDFNAAEIDVVYNFWDDLSEGKLSRNPTNSSSYFETGGGSRAEYVELLGGGLYSTTSVISPATLNWYIVED